MVPHTWTLAEKQKKTSTGEGFHERQPFFSLAREPLAILSGIMAATKQMSKKRKVWMDTSCCDGQAEALPLLSLFCGVASPPDWQRPETVGNLDVEHGSMLRGGAAAVRELD